MKSAVFQMLDFTPASWKEKTTRTEAAMTRVDPTTLLEKCHQYIIMRSREPLITDLLNFFDRSFLNWWDHMGLRPRNDEHNEGDGPNWRTSPVSISPYTRIADLLDPKNPFPSRIPRDNSSKHRSQNARTRNHRTSNTTQVCSQLQWTNLRQDDERQRIQARTTNALQDSTSNQSIQACREATAEGKGQEYKQGKDPSVATTDDIC